MTAASLTLNERTGLRRLKGSPMHFERQGAVSTSTGVGGERPACNGIHSGPRFRISAGYSGAEGDAVTGEWSSDLALHKE
jgi:hypothetical protein